MKTSQQCYAIYSTTHKVCTHFSLPLNWLALRWQHNEGDGVSNHQPPDCSLKRLFRRRSKKPLKLCVTGLCAWNSPVIGEFPTQRTSNAKNVSIWWRHHCEIRSIHSHIIFRDGKIIIHTYLDTLNTGKQYAVYSLNTTVLIIGEPQVVLKRQKYLTCIDSWICHENKINQSSIWAQFANNVFHWNSNCIPSEPCPSFHITAILPNANVLAITV